MRKGMEEFERYYVNTKERVLRDVKKSLVTYSPKIETYYRHSHFFAEEFKRYSTEFCNRIEKSVLPTPLPDEWEFQWYMTESEAELELKHTTPIGEVDQSYVLITVKPRMLNTEEYALRCDTNVRTITQWIRRGKLRAAYKAGNEWRISALTEKPENRGYIDSYYKWEEVLEGLPDEYKFLNQFGSVAIRKSNESSDKYEVKFTERDSADGGFSDYIVKTYGNEEREKLEIVLIANRNIEYIPEFPHSIMGQIYSSANIR